MNKAPAPTANSTPDTTNSKRKIIATILIGVVIATLIIVISAIVMAEVTN